MAVTAQIRAATLPPLLAALRVEPSVAMRGGGRVGLQWQQGIPPLKPNQPQMRKRAPVAAMTRLCGERLWTCGFAHCTG